ncbi:hypothetical protein [Streptomyces tsukubensis]|uniref:Integral membrane protein n=2 Tax=Streptomyces TaxID=1883 RepID=I2MU22_STRT9|nr:hypothetical protein B7R87_02135 [Streptomyces tsukubensis]EIF88269.1 hypothetical protein [Streptomyces tsukubensis NRRL18488]MYS65369.1 hypothetical protein [Streptomyces sp. SID5473]QKM71022.1 hypothetical protein STSU_031695 [Streptomyces tsukubensis NRRL18488]TAI41721.1 hypothetical protein EWI31_25640 [Streptomyces tsukubensis]
MSAEPPTSNGPGPALELLVHGVGGATPEGMLGDPRTVRISGDDKAAVFRRADDVHAESDPARSDGEPVPEAYCWSNLTSGNSARALWLLLLPFMVANLAHWMRPRARGRARTMRLYGALVRLVALSLTVLMTAAACEVALDLVAWQCAGATGCTEGRSWLGFLAADREGWWSQPGRRLALAALIPAALVGLLWYLSHRTWSAYESQRPPTGADVPDGRTGPADDQGPEREPEVEEETGHEPGDHEDEDNYGDGDEDGGHAPRSSPPAPVLRPALGRPGFWYGRRHVARLRAAHTAAGFLTVAGAVTLATSRHDRAGDAGLLALWGRALEAGLVLGLTTVVWVVFRRGRTERRFDARADRTAVTALPGAALTLLALSLLYAARPRPDWVSGGVLPGTSVFGLLALAQSGLALALAVVAVVLQRRARHARSVLGGLGGPAVTVLACALGGVMTGGTAQWAADRLDGSGTPGADGSVPAPPTLLSWQASVIPVLLVLLLVPVLALLLRTWLTARRLAPEVEAEYEAAECGWTTPGAARLGDNGWRPDAIRTRTIARVRAAAGITDTAPLAVGVVAAATVVLGAVAVVGAWRSGDVPGRAFDGGFAEAVAETAQSLGSWLIGAGAIFFVAWGRRAYRDPSARRTIGILWDVGTFWPRAAHPFAPPCYAERAVPDLTWRMCTWTESTRHRGGRLVISGHSQGSVLAAAAVWQLPPEVRGRVALLTYGSPLERLYGRWFPAYFGPEALALLRDEVHCWSNLHRRTDPIGGPVLVAAGDRPAPDRPALKDPLAYGRSVRHPLPEPVLGHSDYQADPAFAAARGELLRLIPGVPRQPGPVGERSGRGRVTPARADRPGRAG